MLVCLGDTVEIAVVCDVKWRELRREGGSVREREGAKKRADWEEEREKGREEEKKGRREGG